MGVVVVSGTVSEVQAAVDGGRTEAQKRSLLARAAVIPRLDAGLRACV